MVKFKFKSWSGQTFVTRFPYYEQCVLWRRIVQLSLCLASRMKFKLRHCQVHGRAARVLCVWLPLTGHFFLAIRWLKRERVVKLTFFHPNLAFFCVFLYFVLIMISFFRSDFNRRPTFFTKMCDGACYDDNLHRTYVILVSPCGTFE